MLIWVYIGFFLVLIYSIWCSSAAIESLCCSSERYIIIAIPVVLLSIYIILSDLESSDIIDQSLGALELILQPRSSFKPKTSQIYKEFVAEEAQFAVIWGHSIYHFKIV